MSEFHAGQRWVSESEPELGLGSILRVTARTVVATFRAANAQREYARTSAPLRRVRFRTGDTIKGRDNTPLTVQSIHERDGLLYYSGKERELCEADLADTISFNKPEERFFAGHLDPPQMFDLRIAALQHQYNRRKSKVRGFVGGRIDLIPHQLYIASEVSGRLTPRVLLADEVGLGKTIEACLILQRLILTGRAQRVLILVPESLVHQWFVELLRRFSLWFHIFDEERCQAIEEDEPDTNPFLNDQLVLCSIRLFTSDRDRLEQVLAAGWDMLVVDEAHHLGWSQKQVSPEYAIVESIARRTPGVLLLTATPEQLGMASHFARLRILDPDRFHDLKEFMKESAHYQEVAQRARKITDPKELETLLDQHGTGRVRFRNTRATITGFPVRIAHLYSLEAVQEDEALFDELSEEFAADTDSMLARGTGEEVEPYQTGEFSEDPRTAWLTTFLRRRDIDKVLLICRSQAKVAAIEAALRKRIRSVKIGVFHEGLSLVQRDRNAAWFAEKGGADILVCSEIGSEGRNFQFAHHLVLFDIPLDPELLEQRIGRLDRIGQTSEIHVHVPFIEGSGQEVLARWYHEGLNAFEKNIQGGREILERFGERMYELALDFHEAGEDAEPALQKLISETNMAAAEIGTRLQLGRDRLLEMHSFRPEVAAKLIEEIRRQDEDRSLDEFMLAAFDFFHLNVEEIAPRTYKLGSVGALAESFPGLPAGGVTVTCDRSRALVREDVQFLTWDHPLVTGALDLLLGSEKGNSSVDRRLSKKTTKSSLEAVYLLECIAPPQLHVDRFLPPTPVTVRVDHHLTQVDEEMETLIEKAHGIARRQVPALVEAARQEMAAQMDHEISRLKELQKVNRTVRTEEIDQLVEHRRALDEHLSNSRLRLDAIRLTARS